MGKLNSIYRMPPEKYAEIELEMVFMFINMEA